MGAKDEHLSLVDTDRLAAAIAAGLATIAPRHEIKEGDPEYVARQRAEGWYDDFYGVTLMQNAYEAQARGVPEEARRRVGQLKAGSYLKNRVKVTVENDGAIVRLSYPVSGDNMMKNVALWKDLADLIDQIWTEQHAPIPA